LDFSQIKNNKLKLVYSEVSIENLLNEIKPLFDHFCRIKNLSLEVKISPLVPKFLTTDRTRLSQVLVNLLGNAFKFTFKGGVKISVNLESLSPCIIEFLIEDSGIGIKDEDKGKLFKLFGRIEHEDQNINTHGVGLGLTISNMLVVSLNPSMKSGITFNSEKGKGSTFSFTVEDVKKEIRPSLKAIEMIKDDDYDQTMDERMNSVSTLDKIAPYKNFLPTPVPKFSLMQKNFLERLSESAFESSKEKHWCLIVDDNPFNLIVANHVMEQEGFQVKNATNGEEALEEAKKHENSREIFKLILMDCQMPVMDGYEASKLLVAMMSKGEITKCPIIALTANNQTDEHQRLCELSGMSGQVSKPLQVNELQQVLHNIGLRSFIHEKK